MISVEFFHEPQGLRLTPRLLFAFYMLTLYTATVTSSIKYSFVSVWQIFFIGERGRNFVRCALGHQNKSSSFFLSWSIRSRGRNKWPRDLLRYFCGMAIVSTTTTKVVAPQKMLTNSNESKV